MAWYWWALIITMAVLFVCSLAALVMRRRDRNPEVPHECTEQYFPYRQAR